MFFLITLVVSFTAATNFFSPVLVKGSVSYFFTYLGDVSYFLIILLDSWSLLNFNKYINNNRVDIDITTNTDGEDLISYVNDFVEISLQERAYFFDWILTSPFEFCFFISFSYILYHVIFKMKIKTPLSVFKNKKNKKSK